MVSIYFCISYLVCCTRSSPLDIKNLYTEFLSQNSSLYQSQWTAVLWGNTYPSTSVPHASIGNCTMDPKPFRKRLPTLPDYSGVEEFIRHAVQEDGTSGGPGAFV